LESRGQPPGDGVIVAALTKRSHIHPDGHEITYVMEGEVVLKLDGKPDHTYKAGEGLHLNANVPHAAQAGPNGVKLLIVRTKPKDKPVAQPVQRTN
jgi:quercetin dioxygenase-like cupin family protein